MNTVQINPAFKNLIPPLSKEEYEGLEQNILADGKVRDALVLWQGTIVDGHNRYEIAEKHGLPYKITDMDFEDEDAVKLWIIDNQLGRRNIPPFARIELAQLREPMIRAKAKENMSLGGGDKKSGFQVTGNPIDKVHTHEQVAKIAKVSHDTYERAKKIMEKAPPEVLQDLREGKRSIHKTERELRVGSKICEVCGEEKPLSRFQNEGGKKCLDCKTKKFEATTADNPVKIPEVEAVESPEIQGADEAGDDEYEENDTAYISEEVAETPAQNTNKLSIAEIALGTGRRSADDSKEYRDDLQKTRDNVKQMAEYSRNHKRTIEEFQQSFRANADNFVDSLEHQFKFMDAEIWAIPTNKQIACDLIDEMVQAISNFKEEFLTWK